MPTPNTTPGQRKQYNYLDGGVYRDGFPQTLPIPSVVKDFIRLVFNGGTNQYQEMLDSTNRDRLDTYIPSTKELRRESDMLLDGEYAAIFTALQRNNLMQRLWAYYQTALTPREQTEISNIIFSARSSESTVVRNLLVAHMRYIKKLIDELEITYGEITIPDETPTTVVPGGGVEGTYSIVTALSGAGDPVEYEERDIILTVKLDGEDTPYDGPVSISVSAKPTSGLLIIADTVVTSYAASFVDGVATISNVRFSLSGAWTVQALAAGLGVTADLAVTVTDKATTELTEGGIDVETNNPVAATFVNCDEDIVTGTIDLSGCGTGVA